MNPQISDPEFGEADMLAWSINGAKFEIQVAGDTSTLWLPDGQIVDMGNREWTALAKAIALMIGKLPPPPTKKKEPVEFVDRPTNSGKPWLTADEARLLAEWNGGATLSYLSATFQRSEVGISSRLVRLGAASSRDDILGANRQREGTKNVDRAHVPEPEW